MEDRRGQGQTADPKVGETERWVPGATAQRSRGSQAKPSWEAGRATRLYRRPLGGHMVTELELQVHSVVGDPHGTARFFSELPQAPTANVGENSSLASCRGRGKGILECIRALCS